MKPINLLQKIQMVDLFEHQTNYAMDFDALNAESEEEAVEEFLDCFLFDSGCLGADANEIWLARSYMGRRVLLIVKNIVANLIKPYSYSSYNRYLISADVTVAYPTEHAWMTINAI